MPDTSYLPLAEGGREQSGGGLNKWWLIGGAGVLGILLIVYATSSSTGSSSSTTAAGTSINAALGSIQEEQLNQMGQIGAFASDTSNNFANQSAQIAAGFTDTQNLINQGFSTTQAQLTSGFAQQASQISGVDSDIIAGTNSLLAELGNVNQSIVTGNAASADAFNKMYSQLGDVLSAQQQTQGTVQALSAADQTYFSDLYQYLVNMQQGLGGSIGTAKGEILTLAYTLGKGQAVQNYLSSRGDFTQSGQTHEG